MDLVCSAPIRISLLRPIIGNKLQQSWVNGLRLLAAILVSRLLYSLYSVAPALIRWTERLSPFTLKTISWNAVPSGRLA